MVVSYSLFPKPQGHDHSSTLQAYRKHINTGSSDCSTPLQTWLSVWSRAECNRQHYRLALKSACSYCVQGLKFTSSATHQQPQRGQTTHVDSEITQRMQESEKSVKRGKARISSRNFCFFSFSTSDEDLFYFGDLPIGQLSLHPWWSPINLLQEKRGDQIK